MWKVQKWLSKSDEMVVMNESECGGREGVCVAGSIVVWVDRRQGVCKLVCLMKEER